MSRNGTTAPNHVILNGSHTALRGLFRDIASRREARVDSRPTFDWSHVYVAVVVLAGCGALSAAVVEMAAAPPPIEWWVLAALTLLSGSAVLKIPAIPR